MFKTISLEDLSASKTINLEIIGIIDGIISLGVELDLARGPWIAGGCLQRCFSNQPLENSDIDIFFNNDKFKFKETERILLSNGYKTIEQHRDVITVEKGDIKIQLICLSHQSVYDLLGDFDFSVVRCAFDGSNFIYHKDFVKDNNNKILKYNMCVKTRNNTAARVIKYMKRGYTLTPRDAITLMVLNRETTKDLYKETTKSSANSFYDMQSSGY